MICDECETVAHCLKNGCVPKQPSKDEAFSTERALKLALYALEIEDAACRYMKDETPSQIVEAITAIKQALNDATHLAAPDPEERKRQWVHATPWRGLTDEDFIDLCEEASNFGTGGLIRHIEAKLKEKNCD
jgi:hypothetical protein